MSSLRQAFKSSRELASYLETQLPELDYPVLVPRSLAQKIKRAGPDSALWKQFVPDEKEALNAGLDDPIADALHSPTPMIVHRYKSRALYLPTQTCPVICRYCFRKNELYTEHEAFGGNRHQAINYLKEHSEIKELIFSGGDPLILSTAKLREHLQELKAIPHLKYLRFHTRTPVILPERIDDEFLGLLFELVQSFVRVTVVVHCNHADEIDPQVAQACQKMRQKGVFILSQSVLLAGVNDQLEELIQLFDKLVEIGVQPYYLHHPDDARGAQHFMLELEKGQKLMGDLRQYLPGWALPRYTMERPQGEGKIDAMNFKNN